MELAQGDHQDRTGSPVQHPLGHATKNRMGQAAVAVAPHHDEVRADLLRSFNDFRVRGTLDVMRVTKHSGRLHALGFFN